MNATSCYWSYIEFYTLITYNYILTYTSSSDTATLAKLISSHRRCSLSKFHRKAPVLESLFYKVATLQACNVTKQRLLHKCFPVKFFTIHCSTRFSFLRITSSNAFPEFDDVCMRKQGNEVWHGKIINKHFRWHEEQC